MTPQQLAAWRTPRPVTLAPERRPVDVEELDLAEHFQAFVDRHGDPATWSPTVVKAYLGDQDVTRHHHEQEAA